MSVYRKHAPCRKPQTYNGAETALPVVPPTFIGSVRCPYSDATDRGAATVSSWRQGATHQAAVQAPWQRLAQIQSALQSAWQQSTPHDAAIDMGWDKLEAQARATQAPWRQSSPHDAATTLPWGDFVRHLASAIGVPWHTPARHQATYTMAWGTLAKRAMQTSALWRALAARGAYVVIPWGAGHHYQTGYDVPYTNPPDDPSVPLLFPDLPVYIMIPTITALVIDGGADLEPLSVTIDEDVDSFCAGFEMQIPKRAAPLVNPEDSSTPVPIRITVNGYSWGLAVDGLTDNKAWKSKTFTARGKSQSVLFGEDWADPRTLLQADDFNIAQLAEHELDGTGWTLIWDTIDYLVPGGTWTYNDLTPIAALQKLAATVGAVLLTDEDALTMRVEPRYSAKPWEWDSATPYAIIPVAPVDSLDGQWIGGSNPNGVYVYAQNASSGALVRITGTDGAKLPKTPIVTDPLLGDSGAQGERGWQELAKAGKIKVEQLELPLLPAPALPGLIPLRALLEVTDDSGTWRGQVMARRITASRSGGANTVRQILTIERQFRS